MNTLQKLGLSLYEARAVEVLVAEDLTADSLSRKARIPPGKVYSVISSLRTKGLVRETASRPKQVSLITDALTKLIDEFQQEDENQYSKIRAQVTAGLLRQNLPTPFFDIGTTPEENRRIQLRTFEEAKQEVCQILNTHHRPNSNRAAKTQWEDAISNATKRGVRFRAIYPASIELPRRLQKLHGFQTRRLNTDFVRCDIIDKKKVLIKLVHEDATHYGGILFLENPKLAKNLLAIFEQLWERAR